MVYVNRRLGDLDRYVAQMETQLVIEFPTYILTGYNGLNNLDETLDDNITYVIGRYFYENEIGFAVESLNFIQPIPNHNDELVRYVVSIEHADPAFCVRTIVRELTDDGFERGCTIRIFGGAVLHADSHSADIRIRRREFPNNAT